MFSAGKRIAILAIALSGLACSNSDSGSIVRSEIPGEAVTDNGVDDVIRVNPVLGLEVHVIPSESDEQSTGLEVHVDFERSPQAAGPRIAELYIEHSENMQWVDATAGPAAVASNKTVLGQAKSNGRVRVIVYSASAEQLESGRIASLRFEGTGDGPFTVRLSDDNQIFAPVEANGNLLVGDAVVIE